MRVYLWLTDIYIYLQIYISIHRYIYIYIDKYIFFRFFSLVGYYKTSGSLLVSPGRTQPVKSHGLCVDYAPTSFSPP